jgi:hypothetical protein
MGCQFARKKEIFEKSQQAEKKGWEWYIVREIPKFMTIDIGSSAINLCPIPVPFGP